MTDRIPCINPCCRRTAPADKHIDSSEICCSKCWQLIPKHLTRQYRSIRQRAKRMVRAAEKRIAKGEPSTTFDAVFDRVDDRLTTNWAAIKSYFNAPPAPAGIENFLKENGIG